ncbi:MAG: TadE/TadG family type IV pilus assembly protein [Bryobacteraceae bacterium]
MKTKTRRRRGNALIEMSLMIVPLFGLLFGIVDFGFAIFIRSTLQHSVREGVRYAVTYQIQPGLCQDDSIKETVKTQAIGFLTPAQHANKIQIRYYDPLTFNEVLAPQGNSPGNIVEVAVEGYQYSWLAPLFWSASPLSINVRASDRMEGLPGGGAAPCR